MPYKLTLQNMSQSQGAPVSDPSIASSDVINTPLVRVNGHHLTASGVS